MQKLKESNYYKIVDEEKGYSKYIRENEERTIILYFGTIEPKLEEYNEKYKKQPGEVILPCSRREYLDKHFEYLISIEDQPVII